MLSSVRFWIGSSGHVIEIISVRIGGRSQYDSMGIKKKINAICMKMERNRVYNRMNKK